MYTLSILQVLALILTLVIRGLLVIEQPKLRVEASRDGVQWDKYK